MESKESAKPSFNRPELLAPAGNWECAKAAIENGADAIYFGLERFNARMRAENFTQADLPELMEFLHRRGVKGYVTLNTLVFGGELSQAEQYLRTIINAGVDAAIVQDIGICRLIRHLSPDFPIHASTQMTVTSAAGVEFAKSLGCELVVLARECSLKEITKIKQQISERGVSLPLEVFVHGALCVAYSGQCLTSESLGGRSANRGECAQACRMPYELLADGEIVELGERKYLLSPQDLAGLDVLPDLVRAGVSSLKIEGRLKSPEYVANVTKVYREALDRVITEMAGSALEGVNSQSQEKYNLEMAFSRGLYTGWFQGINNQELVHARFGKKRGVYLGEVTRICKEKISVKLQVPVKPGDGVVFDNGHPEAAEEGGRIYEVERQGKETILGFSRQSFNWRKVNIGDKVWKTSDPELDRHLRQTFTGENPLFTRPISLEIHGEAGGFMSVIARDELGNIVQVDSAMALVDAHNKPLTTERLQEQFGRLGNTPFCLGTLENLMVGELMMPVSELNRLRREIVAQLEAMRSAPKRWELRQNVSVADLLPKANVTLSPPPELIVLVRNLRQLEAALKAKVETLYCEFEDPQKYKEAVRMVRENPTTNNQSIWVAPPRITKPSENYILQQVSDCNADGYLLRNYDHLKFFAGERCRGDFALNVANPLTADYFVNRVGLELLTASYDLNIHQLEDLIAGCPPHWFEVTIHQRMPMFHMEHCVFCAFLSTGTDFTNCGRPCEKYEVKLRDRVGTEHILQADAGCRNTLFNGSAQTGAEYAERLLQLGVRFFRIEFLNDTPDQVIETIGSYRKLLRGEISGDQLWQALKLLPKLGVTRGSLGMQGMKTAKV
ncbi:U32 family peptidase [Ancylothrix sp. D3o]|uniref:U32 family peptidase n=1 Tax=Ancylothrix sp. D3o TaxID=2953691 RepID=UPI0021BB9CD8|nr:U32 family peptidase [Ancylothrix sp. D3o]